MSSSTLRFLPSQATTLVPVPFDRGQKRQGVALGPQRLLDEGLAEQINELGWDVEVKEDMKEMCAQAEEVDTKGGGDVDGMRNPSSVSSINSHLAEILTSVHASSRLPVTIGGDHSLALATLTATLRHHPDAGILWIDAHADINTPSTTPSGNLHGCPNAFLLGLQGTDVKPFNEWVKPLLKPERIAYIGLRDLDQGERKVLKQLGIRCYTMYHVDRYGIGHVVEEALQYLGAPEKPIHLSFDVDALDPSVAPSTGTPVRGGLTFREGHYICERVWETGSLVAVDLVEVNPDLGAKREEDAKATVAVGCSLIKAALGDALL